jgi:hypothetical protein
MRQAFRVYRLILGAHLRSRLEYEADFWITVVAGVLFQLLNLLFLSAIFSHVPVLHGWSYAECVLISGALRRHRGTLAAVPRGHVEPVVAGEPGAARLPARATRTRTGAGDGQHDRACTAWATSSPAARWWAGR